MKSSIGRDIVIGVAKQIYIQSIAHVLIDANTIEAVEGQLHIMAKASLIMGEVWADAQIEYCKEIDDTPIIP